MRDASAHKQTIGSFLPKQFFDSRRRKKEDKKGKRDHFSLPILDLFNDYFG